MQWGLKIYLLLGRPKCILLGKFLTKLGDEPTWGGKIKAGGIVLLTVALVCVSLASALVIYYFTTPWRPTPPFLGSSVTRGSISAEVVETAPYGLDNPNIRDTPDVWLELIENARETIDMEIYTIYGYSSGPIADFHDAIYRAAARGVKVRMLIDNGVYQDPENYAKKVIDRFDANENIEVRLFSQDMHSKVIIVDNEAAYVGSANQSWSAMESNREVGLLIHSAEIAKALATIFEAGWMENEDQPGFENGWAIDWIYPVATPIAVPSWVAATDETIIGLINSAQSTVRAPVYVFSGSPSTLPDALEDAASRGVNVQIIVDADYGPYDYPILKTLAEGANVQIKTEDLGGYSAAHSKVVIIDGKKAYVGSANWTNTSMTWRREVGIAFEDQTLASALEEIFRTDWESKYVEWVKEPPSQLAQVAINFGVILAVLVLIVMIVLLMRRAKVKQSRKKWIAELWASSRHEI